jgi:hypothetical protein
MKKSNPQEDWYIQQIDFLCNQLDQDHLLGQPLEHLLTELENILQQHAQFRKSELLKEFSEPTGQNLSPLTPASAYLSKIATA